MRPSPPTSRLTAVLVMAVLVVACAGAAPAPASTSTGAPAPTAAPAATYEPPPSLTPQPSFAAPGFAFNGSTPVVTTDLVGSDEAFINPGAVFADNGTYHMFANAFTAWPGKVTVYHLTSSDGVTWTPAPGGPVFTSDDVPFATVGADVSTGFIDHTGTWVLIVESVQSGAPWQIGRVTAPTADGPWAFESEPVLKEGASGAWDDGGVAWPSVVATADGWSMYYAGRDSASAGNGVIGVATSTDGKTWSKRADPVLTSTMTWEAGSLDRPRVAATPDGYAMVYAGRRLTDRGLARSSDGITWQPQGDTPAISQTDFPVPGGSWDAALIDADSTLTYYLEIGGGTKTTGTAIYRATASLP